MPGDDYLPLQSQYTHRHGVPGGIAKAQDVFPGLQHITAVGFPVAGNVLQVKAQLQKLVGTGRQNIGFSEGGQGLVFLMQRLAGGGDVELGHFLAGIGVAGIGHSGLHRDLASLNAHPRLTDVKGGIAQAKTEGIGRLHTEGIKVAVTHIDALFIKFLGQVAV